MSDQSSANDINIDSLFQLIIQKKWNDLIQLYRTNSWAPEVKLNKSEETALHVAISFYESGAKDTEAIHITTMIDCIPNDQTFKTLLMKNNRGNTPLHLAATVGWIAICDHIASKWPNLIEIRNSKGETPVYLATRHGNQKAFLCFSHYYNLEKKEERQKEFELLCRRNDGRTVLHSAISAADFGLAYQIICDYPNLVQSVNSLGESPLHVLAKKPYVFKSDSHLGYYDSIIYHCLFVDELKPHSYDGVKQQDDSDYSNYPENYRTCFNIFRCIWTPILKITRIFVSPGNRFDEENPQHVDIRKDDNGSFPANYAISFFKFAAKAMVTIIVLGIGFWRVNKIKRMKRRYSNAVQVMNKMIGSFDTTYNYTTYKYKNDGMKPTGEQNSQIFPSLIIYLAPSDEDQPEGKGGAFLVMRETPVLMAAKTGIPEMVKKIYSVCPVAIQDLNSNGKNVWMLAAENRQIRVMEYLLSLKLPKYMFDQVDDKGHNVLHLAAMLPEYQQIWRAPGVVLQLQSELRWYKFVKYSVHLSSFARHNKNGETPKQIFTSTHKTLVKDGSIWLTKTSESCSLIAALTATVAFATSSTVPGGVDDETGHPILRNHTAFHVFSITSVLALCLSVTALVFFLSIITSSCEQRDFEDNLPRKLLVGLTTLFASLTAMSVSFFAGHAFILKENLWIVAFPLYFVACAPLTIFVVAKLPLYYDLLGACMKGLFHGPHRQRQLDDRDIFKGPIHRPYKPDHF